MQYFISHASALAFWRFEGTYDPARRMIRVQKSSMQDIDKSGFCKAAFIDKLEAYERKNDFLARAKDDWHAKENRGAPESIIPRLLNGGQTLHVLVPSKSAWRHAKGICCHLCTIDLPPGSFHRLGTGIFVCSPELVFLQMASMLSFFELVELGMELCGCFSLSQTATSGMFERTPLTSTAKLAAFLSKMSGARNSKIASRALTWVIDNSRSPMESLTAMLLTLPPRFGGYGLHRPLLNPRITVPAYATGTLRATHRQCDLFWPEKKVAVEYDSDTWHTGASRIARDSGRRNELAFMGISVVSVTWKNLSDIRSFDRTARLIAKKIGFRVGKADESCLNRRLNLHASLVFRHRNAALSPSVSQNIKQTPAGTPDFQARS